MLVNNHFPLGPLQIEHVGNGMYRLLRDFCYVDSLGCEHTVNSADDYGNNFVFDGESIPVFFRRVVGTPWTGCPEAACIHDMYCGLAKRKRSASRYYADRLAADRLYREICNVCSEHGLCKSGVNGVKYVGVRIAGLWMTLVRWLKK
jgi:hypothetical protein